jgi:aminopeptidase N
VSDHALLPPARPPLACTRDSARRTLPPTSQTWPPTETSSPLGQSLPFAVLHLTPGKLTRYHRAKPSHYAVSLHDIEFGGKFGYQGTVAINTNITKDDGFTDLVLNAHQLKVHSAELKTGSDTRSAKNITYDEKRQRVTLDFGEKITYSGEATLEVKFEGTINNVR